MGEVFEIKNLSKKYSDHYVLKDISFSIKQGEVFGLIGASGAGKTTLLNLLVGFIKPTKGKVFLNTIINNKKKQININNAPLSINKLYGFASQNPSFYERLTVLENLFYFGSMYGLSKRAIRKNADVLLKLLGLHHYQHFLTSNLSGGMKRRLDIACALIHNPPILILDEPTADLDPLLRNQIWSIIKKINMRGTTIILSSHHLNELDMVCNRIAILKNGSLIAVDTPDRIKLQYSKDQELILESFPGNYDLLIDSLKKKEILDISIEGTSLLIKTNHLESVIPYLIEKLKKNNEVLIDLRINKPNLDDIFCQLHSNINNDK